MQFLNYKYRDDPSIIREKFDSYKKYLEENQQFFPLTAYEFATSEWYYNTLDHRCPHDAWVKSLTILEEQPPKPDKDNKGIEIELVLLGAYHDGQIKIVYENVNAYQLNLSPSKFETSGHGDWIIDEVRLSDKNWIIHEIKWWIDGNWQIECKDIKYEWLPFDEGNHQAI